LWVFECLVYVLLEYAGGLEKLVFAAMFSVALEDIAPHVVCVSRKKLLYLSPGSVASADTGPVVSPAASAASLSSSLACAPSGGIAFGCWRVAVEQTWAFVGTHS
jgi:hypothetical protein